MPIQSGSTEDMPQMPMGEDRDEEMHSHIEKEQLAGWVCLSGSTFFPLGATQRVFGPMQVVSLNFQLTFW